MTTPGPNNTSQTARLLLGAPSYAVGWQDVVYLPAPAVGAEWAYTADGRYYERVTAVRFAFTASAVVATRGLQLRLTDANGTIIQTVPLAGGVAAGANIMVNASVGAPVVATAGAGDVATYLPDVLIPPGWSWVSHVVAADPGDVRTGIVLVVQRYPNDAASISAGQ